jgi:malate synthase
MPNKQIDGLTISGDLYEFMSFEVLAGTGVGAHQFWTGFARLVADFGPRLRELLQTRVRFQTEIDDYHRKHAGEPFDAAAYEAFLRSIHYIVDAPAPFAIRTSNVDDAVARVGAPQFVVPCSNPRFLTRAINARWSSLYDALYGSDAIPETGGAERDATYNKVRGALVIKRARDFLDQAVPLEKGSHHAVTSYIVANGALFAVIDGTERSGLKDPGQFSAFQGRGEGLSSVLLRDKGLYIELKIDRKSPVGREDRAGIADVILEAAVTTICDFEDTVVAVDAADKINLYRNWLAVVKGSLRVQFKKNGRLTDRLFSADYRYNVPKGGSDVFAGRSLAMVRVTGLHRMTDLILDAEGQPISEMMLDIFVAALAGVHDTRRSKPPHNSDAGSIYIVVPKLHGPEETAFLEDVFKRAEDVLDLTENVIKAGLSNEETRTSLNLAASIQPLADRIAWLGTSPFEAARDAIGTAMEAGPVGGKNALLASAWMSAYESANIDTALACGFSGLAQIAKGTWTEVEQMARLLDEKSIDIQAGVSTAGVTSPRAATLYALQYHQIDILQRQEELKAALNVDTARNALLAQLMPPAISAPMAAEDITRELEAHCHRILSYLVHCIDRGVGCSRVPDARGTVRMEDRSAVRFSSLCVANWLHHKTVTREQVIDSLRKMAGVVDQQNKDQAGYKAMAPDFDGSAFNAAAELMFIKRGASESDIDTIIAMRRREVKAGQIPEVSNRFQFLKGAMGKLESGEAFFGTAD